MRSTPTHYLATSGQLYYSDAHQFADYEDDYHALAGRRMLGATDRATEMITEIYVPRDRLADFMADVAEDFARTGVDVIYGTVRLIERDDESFLDVGARPLGLRHLQHPHRAHARRPASTLRRPFAG